LGAVARSCRRFRAIVEQVHALFDRRRRTHTALRKLAQLRTKARRFRKLRRALRKLWSPNLEKALTFLDDRLLPATSNTVERANRRHRKMQKTIYRVRTQAHISARIAMDMLRDAQGAARSQTLFALHAARRAPPTSRPRRRAALATVSAATCLSPKHRKAG
jgi:chromosome segregation ATPase